jgi:hypothetical protein
MKKVKFALGEMTLRYVVTDEINKMIKNKEIQTEEELDKKIKEMCAEHAGHELFCRVSSNCIQPVYRAEE